MRTRPLFPRQARWNDAPILAVHRALVAATLGEAEGVLAIDGTDIPKDRCELVGMARQYCGQLGKRADCQAAVFAAYLGRSQRHPKVSASTNRLVGWFGRFKPRACLTRG